MAARTVEFLRGDVTCAFNQYVSAAKEPSSNTGDHAIEAIELGGRILIA